MLRDEEHREQPDGGLQGRAKVVAGQAKPERKDGARNQVSCSERPAMHSSSIFIITKFYSYPSTTYFVSKSFVRKLYYCAFL